LAAICLEDGTKLTGTTTILSSDALRQLCEELALPISSTRDAYGFYHQGCISERTTVEFLRFPPSVDRRFRSADRKFYAQLVRDWNRLEGISGRLLVR
jgi:hypothetical protein